MLSRTRTVPFSGSALGLILTFFTRKDRFRARDSDIFTNTDSVLVWSVCCVLVPKFVVRPRTISDNTLFRSLHYNTNNLQPRLPPPNPPTRPAQAQASMRRAASSRNIPSQYSMTFVYPISCGFLALQRPFAAASLRRRAALELLLRLFLLVLGLERHLCLRRWLSNGASSAEATQAAAVPRFWQQGRRAWHVWHMLQGRGKSERRDGIHLCKYSHVTEVMGARACTHTAYSGQAGSLKRVNI